MEVGFRRESTSCNAKPPSFFGAILSLLFATAASAQEILPFPPTPSASKAGLTIETSTYKKRVEPKRLADGAPNILIILMDDVGPGTPSTYGGEINTPTLDRVAKMGVSFNRFHSTAMCSPTRASLLTGRNHTLRRQWPDRGDGQRLRRLFSGVIPEVVGDRRRSAQELRLQHRRLGQVAQHARGTDHQQGAVRVLADRLRLRVFLRLPGRRGLAVRADPDAQHHRGDPHPNARATTSPRTSPRTPSSGCASRRPTRRTSRSSCTGRRARRTVRTRS